MAFPASAVARTSHIGILTLDARLECSAGELITQPWRPISSEDYYAADGRERRRVRSRWGLASWLRWPGGAIPERTYVRGIRERFLLVCLRLGWNVHGLWLVSHHVRRCLLFPLMVSVCPLLVLLTYHLDSHVCSLASLVCCCVFTLFVRRLDRIAYRFVWLWTGVAMYDSCLAFAVVAAVLRSSCKVVCTILLLCL